MTDYATRRRTMVDTQVRPADVTKFPIIDAMLRIPRESFVPAGQREAAYVGENIPLVKRRVILDPRTLAKTLDALNVQPNELVLDIGAGLGYSSAVVARLAEAVVAVEEDESLIPDAEQALAEAGADNVAVVNGPLAEGSPKHGPYDVILLQGAVETVPQPLLDQLKEGGRIAALYQEGTLGVCRVGYKLDGAMTWRFAFNASAPILPGFEAAKTFAL